MTSPRDIAESLTEAQAEALLWSFGATVCPPHRKDQEALHEKGLVRCGEHSFDHVVTDLGRAVAKELEGGEW